MYNEIHKGNKLYIMYNINVKILVFANLNMLDTITLKLQKNCGKLL